jgi:hypothetical protein
VLLNQVERQINFSRRLAAFERYEGTNRENDGDAAGTRMAQGSSSTADGEVRESRKQPEEVLGPNEV